MKVGDYVRTKNYGICKIIDIYNEDKIELDKINAFGIKGVCYNVENIIKSSPNIIDLIEVGDYVNGKLVTHAEDVYTTDNIYIGKEVFVNYEELIIEEDIKSIVTNEQFSQMEYRIGE